MIPDREEDMSQKMRPHKLSCPIGEQLNKIREHGRIPFHMPGHKRKSPGEGSGIREAIGGVQAFDITEITGCDNLHHPEGVIRESMDQLKEIYGTRESWYLVNGSTAGILASVSAVCRRGDKIVAARNCHQSVHNAIRLLGLSPIYLFPAVSDRYGIMMDVGPEERRDLEDILREETGIRAVVITSPTYEGIVTDIAAVRKVIDAVDDTIVLIVDEAHGAHLHYHEDFPDSAAGCGADLVVQSTHKTLPAMTQTGLLHLCSDRVDKREVSAWLSVYETSSPSYILMASAEAGVIYMCNHQEKTDTYIYHLRSFRKRCRQLLHIHLMEQEELPVYACDIGKLLFLVDGKENGGAWLFHRLGESWQIEAEMMGRSCVLAMTSVMDEEEDFARLFEALSALDEELAEEGISRAAVGELAEEKTAAGDTLGGVAMMPFHADLPRPVKVREPWERVCVEAVPLKESAGRVAASSVMLYPPGIPLILPGEKILKEMVENLLFYLYNGYIVQGLATAGGRDEWIIYCDGGTGRIREVHTDRASEDIS